MPGSTRTSRSGFDQRRCEMEALARGLARARADRDLHARANEQMHAEILRLRDELAAAERALAEPPPSGSIEAAPDWHPRTIFIAALAALAGGLVTTIVLRLV